jgi:hypothetical protein
MPEPIYQRLNPVYWTATTIKLPPEGVPVRTISPSGTEITLVRRGNDWCYSNSTVGVRYVPAYWRPLEEPDHA